MATIEQIKTGAGDFIMTTMIPRMDPTRQFIAGVATEFAKLKAEHILRSMSQKEWAHIFGIVDAEGIDVDTAMQAASIQFQRQPRFPVDVPYFGHFEFDASDLRDLYNRIRNA